MHVPTPTKKTGVALLGLLIAGAFLFAPIVVVRGQTPAQQAPPGTCPTIQSIASVIAFRLGELNATLRGKDASFTVILNGANLSSGTASLQSVTATATNLTSGKQVLFLNSQVDSVSTIKKSASITDINLSLSSLDFRANPAFAQTIGLPLTSLHVEHFFLELRLDCSNGTYTTSFAATTTAANIIGSYLANSKW